MIDQLEQQKYNSDLGRWGRNTRNRALQEVQKITKKYSGHSRSDLKSSTRKFYGEVNRISFSFPVYMVFVHKGAGRGYGGSKTGLFSSAQGGKGVTNPKSMGKMGTGLRQPKPWFNPIIEQEYDKLAGIVAEYKGNRVLKEVQKVLIR